MVYKPDGLSLFQSGFSGQDLNQWLLDSEDPPTTVRVENYISDGQARGMRVGDTVHLRQWTTFTDRYNKAGPLLAEQRMTVVSVDAASDGVDLSDGLTIPLTDTD